MIGALNNRRGELTTHLNHKFSVTVQSHDLALVNCFRALSKFSQKTGNNNIPWGGTKDKDWMTDGHKVTFHFSDPGYREGFVSELNRLLPQQLWFEVGRSDNDPAQPARR